MYSLRIINVQVQPGHSARDNAAKWPHKCAVPRHELALAVCLELILCTQLMSSGFAVRINAW